MNNKLLLMLIATAGLFTATLTACSGGDGNAAQSQDEETAVVAANQNEEAAPEQTSLDDYGTTSSSVNEVEASTDAYSDNSDDSNDDSSSSETSSKGSTDFDEWLTAYEDYVDKYISLLKRAKAGDMEAMSEYASMMESAQELSSKIGAVSSDLTASQVARYQRINNKLMKAAQELN